MKTDLQIKRDIEDELKWDPAVTSTDIMVAVKDGVVSLTEELACLTDKPAAECAAQRVSGVKAKGTVHSWSEWQAAQGAAWSAPGVSGVTNELTLA